MILAGGHRDDAESSRLLRGGQSVPNWPWSPVVVPSRAPRTCSRPAPHRASRLAARLCEPRRTRDTSSGPAPAWECRIHPVPVPIWPRCCTPGPDGAVALHCQVVKSPPAIATSVGHHKLRMDVQ